LRDHCIFSFHSRKGLSIAVQEQSVDTVRNEPGETSSYVKGLTPGRAKSLAGAVVGLVSLIIGWRARARVAGNPGARSWIIAALVFGLVAIGLGAVHLANVTGGFGTGGGKAGAIVALLLGAAGTTLNGLALRGKKKL
jgi:hypothetical protein